MGKPGCSSHRCIWVQHQHKSQEGLAPLLSDPGFLPQEANLETAILGSMASWSPVSYTQAPEQGWVIQMLFTLILDPSVHVSVHVYLSDGIFQTGKATPW